jgi:DNA-binding transcriptional regulator GbsR (MarR family)
MQTHELEVVIPDDHRLTVDIPETIRSGPARLILVVSQAIHHSTEAHSAERSNTEEIDTLYTEIRELMAQSAGDGGLQEQIRDRFSRLRRLQEEEADVLEARFQVRRRLRPGEGRRALEQASQIIANASR